MNRFQLAPPDLEIREEFRSSRPVPEPDRNRFQNRSPNSSTISRIPKIPPKGGENPEPVPASQAPLPQESRVAALSPGGGRGGRGQGPTAEAQNSTLTLGTAGTAPALRPYQADAIAAVERELADKRSTLLVLPTGCGKTVVFAELARRWVAGGDRTLVLAHRTELLDQAARKLADVGVTASIDQGQRIGSRWADVVVASVQTLQRQRLLRYPAEFFRRIIVDEAHHAPAKSYGNVFERFTGAKILGVTATPDRGDGKGLGTCFESLAFTYEMRRAISDRFLAPLRAKRILVEDIDLSGIKNRAGDFAQDELSRVLNEEGAVHGVVAPLVEMAGDRRTLVFGVDVAHARAIAEVINRHKPGAAIALDGGASGAERAAVLALFRRGAFQFLVNCGLFAEGFDEPSISCVALARPTQSRALYTQMLGRGTRLHPGKTECLVLDFVGNSGRHRLVGPADALAGRDLPESIRAEAEKNLDGQLELEDVLANAEEEAKKRKRAVNLIALATYREREVDLFLGDLMPPWDPNSPAAKEPATPDQLARIVELKLGVPPHGLCRAEAAAMIEAVRARRSAGLCTIPQARLLEKCGLDSKGVSFARAGELISKLKAMNAWNAPWRIGAPEYKPGRRRA